MNTREIFWTSVSINVLQFPNVVEREAGVPQNAGN